MNSVEILNNAQLKPTKARIAVLNTLINATNALSQPEILAQMTSQKEFNRVTIYRVLDWLSEHRIIHKISTDNRAWKYQLSLHAHDQDAHHHAHLQCINCGKISCIHELSPHFSKSILEKYHVEAIDIHFKGLCEDCFFSTTE
ncbi:MAG: transcriptional repressor [Methylotenera sp.]|nr:transcriptional repressor [Methylotenera sp.]